MMKFTLLGFIFMLLVLPCAYPQESPRITVDMENVTLRKFFSYIEKNYAYTFVYNNAEVDDKQVFSVKIDGQTIGDVLTFVLKDKDLDFRIQGTHIVLRKKSNLNGTNSPKIKKRVVTGVIADESGIPVIGAIVADRQGGAIVRTGVNGQFSIEVKSDEAQLDISYIGFIGKKVPTAGKSALYVVLKEDTKVLEEVVVVGYGTVRRRDLTGSVSSLKGSALKDIPVTTASQAIAGRLAGVQTTSADGSQDVDIKIRVRGGGSITQDNSPLYIVDGFPQDNINSVSPNDIATIDVLKDASSTAIYGARGANGVIVITTKSGAGVEGKGVVNYSGYVGVKQITKTLDVLNPYEFTLWQYERDKINSSNNYEKYYGKFQDMELYKQIRGTNWQEEVFGRIGTSSVHNLSVSGNNKGTRYNISLTRSDEKEIMIGARYSKTNLNARFSNNINRWLTVGFNVMFSDLARSGAGTRTSSRLSNTISYRPISGLSEYVDPEQADPADYEASVVYNKNPVLMTMDDYRRYHSINLTLNGMADIKLTKSLKYRIEYGSSYGRSTNKQFFGLHTPNVWEYGGMPIASINKSHSGRTRFVHNFTYTKKGIHPGGNLTLMAGQEIVVSKSGLIQNSAKYFPRDISPENALGMLQLGISDPVTTKENPPGKLVSFFGRANYSLYDRYLLTATLRADGSSKFARGNRWGYFPSAALAWRVNEESFMNPAKKWMSELKFRISYGLSGNNRIPDNVWKKTFQVKTSRMYISEDESSPTPYLATTGILDNPSLKWETTYSFNMGLDFGLFKRRLTGSVDVYKNITRDLLISATIPSHSGYSTQWQNIGQTSNKGIELTLNGVIVSKKDFKLSASFNISFNRNRIDKLGDTKQWEQISKWTGWSGTGTIVSDYLVKEGAPIGQMYGYQTDGMYAIDDFNYDPDTKTYTLKDGVPSNESLLGMSNFGPGALKFIDQNGDGIVDQNDKVVIGDANPKHTGGFNLSVQYKGFDLSAFFNWVYGNNIYNANKVYFTSFTFSYAHRNLLNIMNSENRFMYVDKNTGKLVSDPVELAELNKNATIWSPNMSNMQLHSWVIEDGSFLRLNTLTLGYTIPKTYLERWKIREIRIYVSFYNLYTWTNYTGYDPEVDVVRTTPLTPGIDWSAHPRTRSFNLGANVKF